MCLSGVVRFWSFFKNFVQTEKVRPPVTHFLFVSNKQMSSGIVQEPGFDTKIQQFTPIRNAPVWRRAVRQYHCLEDVNGTSDFTRLQFKVHCQEKNLVCNDARLVFPLELIAHDKDPEKGPSDAISMAVNDGHAACNIAVAQNSPWNSFETVNCVVNTKVYTEKPRAYGRTLSNTYQSVSEMQFMNNHSLKPIANTDPNAMLYNARTVQVRDRHDQLTGDTVTINEGLREPSRFVLENANSGFLERSRQFQDSLDDEGKIWKGEISSLLNCGPFSAEARGQGNDQLPYIEDLFLSLVFKQTKCSLDASLLPSRGPDYRKVIVQSLFEYLTPANAALYKSAVQPNLTFPNFYTLRWLAKPYIQIEWLKYDPGAMLPMYRLQGFQHKLTKSNEFSLAHSERLDERAIFSPRVSTQCLSVPNKLYIWAELSENSARDSFLFGGMFRTCEIMNRSLTVRVNGESHIIDRPDNQSMLFKWWKRHSNSVAEYPTWAKCPVIILTPNEIGLSNWLENDAVLSTIEISCDVRLSKLQLLEYNAAIKNDGLMQAGVHNSVHNAPYQEYVQFRGLPYSIWLSDFYNSTRTGRGNLISIQTEEAAVARLDNDTPPFIPTSRGMARELLSNYYLSNVHSLEQFRVRSVDRALCGVINSVWVKYDMATRTFVSPLFFVPKSHVFEFAEHDPDAQNFNEANGIMFCPWSMIQDFDGDDIPNIAIDPDTGDGHDLSRYIITGRTYAVGHLNEPLAIFNYDITMPGGIHWATQQGSAPGPAAIRIPGGATFTRDDLQTETAYYDDDDYKVNDPDIYTTIWGEDQVQYGDTALSGPTSVRWVCMNPVVDGADNAGYYVEQTSDGYKFNETIVLGYYDCRVSRGANNTLIDDIDYSAHSIDRALVSYPLNHTSETSASKHFKYELNVLAEYSNQQIVMDTNRRVAVQIENNVPVSV